LNYNIIIDEIFVDLNGYTFKEKAISDIKEKAKIKQSYCSWLNEWNYDVKGKIIKFRFNIKGIMPALYFYDNNEMDIIDCFTHNKIDNYTSYVNGNADIKFYSKEFASEFAKKYLGYYEMSEEERETIMKAS
jgi:hypothetical protein